MFTLILVTAAILSASTALKCAHNGTVINDVYQRGVLVYSSTSRFEFGVYTCSPNLNRCASFNSIDVAFFKTLDAGRTSSSLSNNLAFSQGKFTGRSCMSQVDVERIFAVNASRCTGSTSSSCYCTTDASLIFPMMPNNPTTTTDNELNSDETTLLCLPNELLIEVIEFLPLRDRRNLGFACQRLLKLGRIAGKIRFQGVYFHNVFRPKFEFTQDNVVYAIKPTATVSEIAEIFGHKTTEQLKIEGRISTAFDGKLRTAFKTLTFKSLSAKFNEDYSGRIIGAVLDGRKDVDSIEICWKTLNKEVDSARNILKKLPPVKTCKILVPNYSRVITDEIFLHLVNTVSGCLVISCPQEISAHGLATAFQIACSSEKYINCYVHLEVFEEFELNFSWQYHRDKHYHYNCLVHLESSTVLIYHYFPDTRDMLVNIYRYNLLRYFS